MALALARITDLFVEGKELVIRPEPQEAGHPPAVLVWVNKLNAFEQEEARRDGAVARARMVLAIDTVGSPEKDLYEASLVGITSDMLREQVVGGRSNSFWMTATNAVRVDPEWSERYLMVQRPQAEMSDAEVTVMAKVTEDYYAELQTRVNVLADVARAELQDASIDDLRAKHREMWIEDQTMRVFGREYNRTRVFYGLRACKATVQVEGRWDHATCDHSQQLCEAREDRLPDSLTDQVRDVLMELDVPADDARFSAGAVGSSEPSPRPSLEEASVPSGPEVSSPEQVTTS